MVLKTVYNGALVITAHFRTTKMILCQGAYKESLFGGEFGRKATDVVDGVKVICDNGVKEKNTHFERYRMINYTARSEISADRNSTASSDNFFKISAIMLKDCFRGRRYFSDCLGKIKSPIKKLFRSDKMEK